MQVTAAEIYQRNLDAVTRALWSGDLALMLDHISLPNQMLTEDAEFIIASADEMFELMTDFRLSLQRMGADGYRRICRFASYLGDRQEIIIGQHETHVLQGDRLLRPVYLNDMTLIRTATGDWHGIRIEARARNVAPQILSPDMVLSQRRALVARIGAPNHPASLRKG